MLATNRVENELNHWRTREERFSKLFSFSLSSNKVLLKEKLDYFDGISAKYKDTKSLDERFALGVLGQERLAIEKQLYPNYLIRMLRRIFISPLKKQFDVRNDHQNTEQNRQSLQLEVDGIGFHGLSSKLGEQINQGNQQFSIPVSYYVNEKERLDHLLSFSKDDTGCYRFDGFTAKLQNEARKDEKRNHYFGKDEGMVIDTRLAYQLLQGRSIQKDGKWLQLDMNDKDAQDNYRVKEFHSAYGFDLDKILKELPLKELRDQSTAYNLIKELKKGSRQPVSFVKDGKEQRYYIEANPQFKSINIYDEHSRKTTLATVKGNSTLEAVKLTHKINEKEVQGKAKRNTIAIS